MAQSVEHVIGNDEVISSILITSSKKQPNRVAFFIQFVTVPLYTKMASNLWRLLAILILINLHL